MSDQLIEEYLEKSSIIQDDYKKLKEENECYRQEVYILRLKLETAVALEKELQEANEALELSLSQSTIKIEKILAEKEEKYRAAKEEYENQISDLQMNIVRNVQEITELREQLKQHKNFVNAELKYSGFTEDSLHKEKFEESMKLLENETKKREQLEERLADMENQNQELHDILKVTKEHLAEKTEVLETAREELAMKRMELESLKTIPASDTCKGNSLFAEVEDRRQMLLDKMQVLQTKYNETKRIVNTKTSEIKILKAEKAAMVKKWETDAIDTMQENTDLLEKYKSKIFELENKLKSEMKKSSEARDEQFMDDNFNYAQKLLAVKKKELEQLNEKLDKQSMKILAQEEINHDISKQLRYWRCKAMSIDAQMLAIKTQLEKEQINDDNNKASEEIINDCTIANFEKICDTKVISGDFISENNICPKSTEMLEKSIVDRKINEQNECSVKALRFAVDTTDNKKKFYKKQTKQKDYPVIIISNDL